MQLDWSGLLDALRVPWKDRGPNCSRGNINVCCPFCGNDSGYHLGISLHKEAFYCFRQPNHAGGNFIFLLVKLGVGRDEAVRLLNSYRGIHAPAAPPEPVAPDAQLAAWERFEPAERCAAALDYLYHRGYDEPERVAARYDLRFARLGKWSGRLLLPLSDGEELRSWTGRAWGLDEPKYLEQKSGLPGLVYSPRPARNTLLLVEGPMDALKLAVAGEDLPVAATALTGKAISPERLWRIVQLAKASQQILLALDSDAALAEAMRLLAELKAALPGKVVRRVKMPEHHKDPGEIPLYLAQQWLFGLAG